MEVQEGQATVRRSLVQADARRAATGHRSLQQYLKQSRGRGIPWRMMTAIGKGTTYHPGPDQMPLSAWRSGRPSSMRAMTAAWSGRMSLVFNMSERTRRSRGATWVVGPEELTPSAEGGGVAAQRFPSASRSLSARTTARAYVAARSLMDGLGRGWACCRALIPSFFDGKDVTVYSMPNAAKIAHIKARPQVSLNLDSDGNGRGTVVVAGAARVDRSGPIRSRTSNIRPSTTITPSAWGWATSISPRSARG